MEFFLQNGKMVSEQEFNPKSEWRDYPVTFRTHMWFAHGIIPFFDNHINLISENLRLFNLNFLPEDGEAEELHRLVIRLINKNKAYMGGWLILEVFAGNSGWTYIATIQKHYQRLIPYDEQGKLAQVSGLVLSKIPAMQEYHLFSEKFWAAESLKIAGSRFGETIYCTRERTIISSIGANLYCISGDTLFTPSIDTGCPRDNFRRLTLEAAVLTGLSVTETDNLTEAALMTMDEIFTASERSGFKWILGIGFKRFLRKRSEIIRNSTDHLLWKDRIVRQAGH